MKTIIVENDYRSRTALDSMIKQFCPELKVVASASSIEKAKIVIEHHKPELVFLEIQLSDGISFELLNQLQDYNFKVVFVTTDNKHAFQAFEYAAIHYLLKPINPEALGQVIQRLNITDVKEYKLNEHVSILKDLFGKEQIRLGIPTQKELVFINISNIVYCKADTNYTEFYLEDDTTIVASKSLLFFERILDGMNFVRPHNKYLVNTRYITKYIRGRGGVLLLSNDTSISVSVRRKALLLKNLSTLISVL